MRELLKIRVPGKLMLMGEYAVLEPGSQALVMAVDRYVRVTLQPASQWSVLSDLQPGRAYAFETVQGIQWPEGQPAELKFVAAALEWGMAYLQAKNQLPEPYTIEIQSQLHEAERKLGLGSSAAVTMGVLAGLLAAAGEDLKLPELRSRLFKLALLAHHQVQQGGSGADLAACIHGKITCYTRSQIELDGLSHYGLLETIDRLKWPALVLEPLDWPDHWHWQAGWTGHPASTTDFIAEWERLVQFEPEVQLNFLFSSNAATAGARQALLDQDWGRFAACVAQARRLLQELQEHFLTPLETPLLEVLSDLAVTHGGVGKFSGAGGGDCGLALFSSMVETLPQAWLAAGIQPLSLNLDLGGVTLES